MTQRPTINAIYRGTITPSEGTTPSSFPEYQKMLNKAIALEQELIEGLSADGRNTLCSMLDIRDEACDMEAREAFAAGFKIGANLMIEVLNTPAAERGDAL